MAEKSTVKLTVKNLYKIFGTHPKAALKLHGKGLSKEEIFVETGSTVAVADVNLEIYEGEIFVIMGLSGSGKSTLVRLFNRLIEPSGGQVLIDGEDVVAMDEARLRQVRREKISMVFQSFALMPHLTNRRNVAFGLELAGVAEAERNERAQAASWLTSGRSLPWVPTATATPTSCRAVCASGWVWRARWRTIRPFC